MYAVIGSGGKQYRVSAGDVLRVEKLTAPAGASVTFPVLAWRNEAGEVRADGARVSGTVLNHGKAAKILVFHYKRKKQYKKLQGHRQRFTTVRVNPFEV